MKKYRSWTVDVVANGFIVNIGCQRIVAETPENLLYLIKGYLDDPEKATKELFDNSIIFNTSPTGDPTPTINRTVGIERPEDVQQYLCNRW
jgi:hypothetical protein